MAKRPVVFLHGYSDSGAAFNRWRAHFCSAGWSAADLHVVSYATLTDEVTIRDIAEGFGRALAQRTGLDRGEPFDAVVHSTGMLVIRAWLAGDPVANLPRLKHLLALAPATNGSPLAHKGRSFLGAIFKGNKALGEDFLEAGTRVLDALELGSRFTWDLAMGDQFGPRPFYGDGPDTPYVGIFCGTSGYDGISSVVNEDGADGTVRWAGCALDSRMVTVDLSEPSGGPIVTERPASQHDVPVFLVDAVNHGTILTDPPTAPLVRPALALFDVETADDYHAWLVARSGERPPAADAGPTPARERTPWQQFVVRLRDERGDPVGDWNLQFRRRAGRRLEGFAANVHPYGGDRSVRCFHVNLAELGFPNEQADLVLRLELVASTGTSRVEYAGGSNVANPPRFVVGTGGTLQLDVELPAQVHERLRLFYPLTTTFLELRINRETQVGPERVLCWSP